MKLFFSFLLLYLTWTSPIFAHAIDTSRWANSAVRLNTDAAESHPLLSADGRTMYFVRNNHPQNLGEEDKADIWVSYRDSTDTWSNSVNIGSPLNNDNDNKVVGINLSNEVLYLTGNANDKIYISKNKNRTWGIPRAVEIKGIANNAAVLNCHVSLDEKYIVFALSNDSCVGKRDLFFSEKNGLDVWSAPRSLGALVNTAGDEANVFLAADNRTLYFTSNGRDGLGGLDWYMTRRLDDSWLSWSSPKNLGNNINTSQDDLYFCVNTELKECYGIRQNSTTDSDITRYFIYDEALLPTRTLLIRGKVQTVNGEPVQTVVQIQRLKKSDSDNLTLSKADGTFQVMFSEGDQVGFYALDKNVYSSFAYINLTETPLKILDEDGTKMLLGKDSVRLLSLENLQIRINQINIFLTELEKKMIRSKALDFAHLPDFIDKSNSFEVNQKLEKLRLDYNKKYGKQIYQSDLTAVTNIPKYYDTRNRVPIVEDSAPSSLENRVELMKKGFEEKKKNKEGSPSVTISTDNENSKEDERKAIDEVKDLHGVVNENAPDFDMLLSNTQRKIALNSVTDVKGGLQKEFIEQWNNWESLNFNPNEERKIRGKMEAIQRRLKQFLEEKNAFDEQQNGASILLTEDEANVAKEIKNSVISNLRNYLKQDLLQEINYQMSFRLNDELRTILYKSYEKEKKNSKNTNSEEIIKVNSLDNSIAADEQQMNISITLYPMKTNVTIILNGIYFKANTADILPESEAELMRLQRFLEEDSFRVIELSAHTHGYCGTPFADLITQQRLQNLKKALVNRDIAENRIWLRPFGKSAPLAPNNTLDGRLLNQRIEMKLINK